MTQKLHSLISKFASANHESELRSHFMVNAGDILTATAWGWKFFANDFRVIDFEFQGLPSSILQHYEEIGYRCDPLMCFAIQSHAPVHEEAILTPKNWQRSIIYQHVFSRYNIEHLAIAPLIGDGGLLGKIYFTRSKNTPPFTQENLLQLSALSTHLSVCLTRVKWQQKTRESPLVKYLTPREQQIANLIAEGLKTAELSAELGITQNSVKQALKRMFAKLNVSTRAEMIAKLRTISSS
ncbi:MAG: LuxR C-terminal-related transcriptional regulator [Xenococcaceae cyanobacterium MO_188.B32]|nr:LuxR C-terminal-related transcriptional regulator [Xenococcaceae cyanobacterium MO_188.B32]